MKGSKYRLAALVALLGIVTHFRWFTGFDVLVSGDWQIRYFRSLTHLLDVPLAWRPIAMGEVNIFSSFYVIDVIHAALSRPGLSFGVVERLEFLWPIAILTPLGAYLLVRKLTRSDVGALLGSAVYAYNVYFLMLQTQHLYIMLANAFVPFAVLAYIRLSERRRLIDAVIAGFALFAVSAADFRIFYMFAFVLAGWAVFKVAIDREWRVPRAMFRAAGLYALPFVIVAALNAYWIIGLASVGSLSSNLLLDRGLFGSQYNTLAYAFTLFRGSWTGGEPQAFGVLTPPWSAWVIPAAAFAGLIAARRDRRGVFFGIAGVFGIFLAKQSNAPFWEVYGWLFEHVPGFNAFREASKFGAIVAVSYAVLTGFMGAWIGREYVRRSGIIARSALVALFALVLAVPLMNTAPLMNGSIGTLFVPKIQRPAYKEVNEFLDSRPGFFRTVETPRETQWVDRSAHRPAYGINRLMSEEWRLRWTEASIDLEETFNAIDVINSKNASEMLDRLSIRYLIVPLQDPDNHEDPFTAHAISRSDLLAALDAAPFLRRVEVGTGEVGVYENPDAWPQFSAVTEEGVRAPEDAVFAVESGAARWDLTVRGVHGTFSLHFSDTFHSGWELTDADGNGVAATHEEGMAGENVFVIDVAEVCSRTSCEIADDGTVTLRLGLYFTPQDTFTFYFRIGIATLIVCVGYMVFELCIRKNKKRDLIDQRHDE